MKKHRLMVLPFILLFTLVLPDLFAQDFSRVIELKTRTLRMNGPDVTKLQNRLLSLGFKKTGAADGWYGPLTEGTIRTVQSFLGFAQDGKVTRPLWNLIFDTPQEALLKNISIISNYNNSNFTVTSKRIGGNLDFDDFIVSSLNNEIRIVLFQHVNEGLLIFRFRVYYLPGAAIIRQDVYYGDYRTRLYLKNSQGFFELKNGGQIPADPALEGILNRIKEQTSAIMLPVPASQAAPPEAPAAPAPAAPATPAVPAVPAAPAPADSASAAPTS
jgi:peptidoglycan hydrolase-like protein with peptidoglycan-binding domain